MQPTLKTEDAAVYLGKSASTLAQWRRKGFGPAYTRVGGTVRYSKPALDAFLLSSTTLPASHAHPLKPAATILGAAA